MASLVVVTVALLVGLSRLSEQISVFDMSYTSLLALLVICIGLIPSALFYLSGFAKPIPLLELVFLFYALMFGIPALSESGFRLRPDGPWLAYALLLVAVSLGCAWIGHWAVSARVGRWIRPIQFPIPASPLAVERLGWTGETISIVYVILKSRGIEFGASLDQLAMFAGTMGKIALCYLYFSKRLTTTGAVLLFMFVMPFELVVSISSGLLAEFMRLMLLAGLVYVYVKRRVPWVVLVSLATVFVLLNPVKGEYRRYHWSDSPGNAIYAVQDFVGLAVEHWSGSGRSSDAVDGITRRADLAGLLAYTMDETPSREPYLNGETLLPLMYMWIPRVVWPGKPTETLGNEWAKSYGIIEANDYQTSWNLPWVIEFYINFGISGVLVGMFLVGCLVGAIERLFSGAKSQVLPFCAGLSVALTMWYAESNVSMTIGNLLTKVIFAVVLTRVMVRSQLSLGRQRMEYPAAV